MSAVNHQGGSTNQGQKHAPQEDPLLLQWLYALPDSACNKHRSPPRGISPVTIG